MKVCREGLVFELLSLAGLLMICFCFERHVPILVLFVAMVIVMFEVGSLNVELKRLATFLISVSGSFLVFIM